jgi:hypothetical protein
MKKLLLLIAVVMLSHTTVFSQGCLPEGIMFTTQAQIDSFQINYPNCTEIEGVVFINHWSGPTDISNLNGLNVLTSIGGDFYITNNPLLKNLSGLEGLTSIGGQLRIDYNDSLTSIGALMNLSSIGDDLSIDGNLALTSITGLENISAIQGDLVIDENLALSSMAGLAGLTSIGGNLYIGYCSSLTNLTGLENLASIGYSLYIYYNSALTSLTGINNIDGGSIHELHIYNNDNLSVCDVESICDFLSNPPQIIYILNNAPGCNNQAEVEDACGIIGVEEISHNSGFSIYPNPSTSQITIETPVAHPRCRASIISLTGQELIVREVTEPRTVVDISHLPAGVYFVKMVGSKETRVYKLIRE